MAVKPLRRILIPALALFLGLLGVAQAQDNDPLEADPPDRAARLAYLKGDVSLQPAGEEEWAPAMLNRPLTTGDKLWTERGARVELQVGQAAVRLDGETGFSILNLDDDTVQMRMTAGTIIVDVRSLEDREQIEIDTPNLALSLLRAGSYRVEVNDDGDVTTVKIGEGEAEASGPSTNTLVHSGQAVTFRGVDELVADTSTLGAPDDFDNWSMEREHRDDRYATSGSSQYVSRDVTGYDDLDENGSWSSEAEYGYVWTPTRVAVGWSPYRYGRWVWVGPWGWTWIDDAPWGYAPFHYGRWAHIRNRWCWVPGPRHVRAVYAPALVGWAGSHGSHLSWFPLGPREVYVPGRRFSRHYVERVNVANTIVAQARIREMYERRGPAPNYRNRAVPDAITSVARETFTSAQRTGNHRVRLDPRELNGTPGHDAPPRIAPVRDSRLGGVARANPRVRPDLATRQVIVKRDPPPSSARFARRPQQSSADVAQTPASRTGRPQTRDAREERDVNRDVIGEVRPQDRASFQDRLRDRVAERNRGERNDRPPRNEQQRPVMDNAPSNDERDRWQQRSDETQRPRRDDRPDRGRDSQYPQYSQRPQRTQDAVREAVARQIEQRERQQREQGVQDRQHDDGARAGYRPEHRQEQPRAERPQMEERPRQDYRRESRPEPRQEQPRSQPRQEQPRPERQQERQPRQESQPRPERQESHPPRGRPEGRNSKE
ncbi:MAG TPA: DUF6600 domain-containing protein [Steroidobacteraceae bacterium]|nr:DUF6600 domain-containing protein [Steroidobacteraceae bacterium]